jgi:PKD repeat protein
MKKIISIFLIATTCLFNAIDAQTVTDTITYPLDNLSGGGTAFTIHPYITDIGQYFTVNGAAQVTGAIVFFAGKKQVGTSDTYNVRVYNTGTDSLPIGAALATTTFTTSAVDTANQLNTFTFSTPASVTNRFVVSVEYAATTKNDTNWVFSNNQGDGLGYRRALVKLNAANGGNWDQIGDVFYAPGTTTDLDVDFLILPIYTQAQNPYAQFVASSTNVNVGQTVTFTNQSTGSPTPTYSWLFNPNTFSYTGGTGASSTNPQVQFLAAGTYSVTLIATNTNGTDQEVKTNYIVVSGGGGTPNNCDTIYNIGLNDTLRLYTVPAANGGGYVHGHNGFGDISKAEFFVNPNPVSIINNAFLYFAVAKASNSTKTISVRIWDNTGLDGDGNSGAPGTMLGSRTINIQSIPTGGVPLAVNFSPPVNVTTNFFIGITYAYASGDTVALYSNANGETVPGTAWEQWGPSAPVIWYPYSTSWTLNLSLAILADICKQCPAITVNTSGTNNTSCSTPNGSVTVTASGGTSPYTYNNGLTTNSTGQFTGLNGGTYNITVTDASGCTATATRTITNTAGVTLTIGNITANTSCNAPFNGSFTATISGGTAPYSYSISNGTSGTSPIAGSLPVTGLAPGTYTGTVTDAAGCSSSGSVTIANNAPTVTLTQQSVTPNTTCGTSNGAFTVSASGATSPYTYNNGSTTNQTGNFTALAAGNYNVTATSSNGCSATISVTVPNNATTLNVTTSNIVANTNCSTFNGAVTITVAGGTSPYTATINSQTIPLSSNPYTASGLPGASSSGIVTDANGCTGSVSFTIPNNAPTVTLSQQGSTPNTSCAAPNGSFTMVASAGTSPYTYTYNAQSNQTGVYTGIGGGTYTVTVSDANGCTGSGSATVTNNTATVSIQATSNNPNTSCTNPNGNFTVQASGGSAPYTYNNGVNTNGTGTFSSLSAGTYNVTVTDNNGCTGTLAVNVVNNTPALSVTQQSLTPNTSCSTPNGAFTVTAIGGTAPYTYNNGVSTNQTGSFSQLPAGTYSVTATSANGCTGTLQVSVANNSPTLNLQVSNNTPNSSCGSPNGTITISATGGNSPYSYTGSGSTNTTGIFSGLAAGTYTFTATDASSCTGTVSVTVGNNVPNVTVSITSSNNNTSCASPNGSFSVTANGGTAPYSYNNGSSTNTTGSFTGLQGGTYNVTATDAAGCSGAVSAIITNSQATVTLNATSINASAQNATDGSASVTATGGATPYTYTWSNSGTTATISGLAPGVYTVTVTDANGCSATASATVGFSTGIGNQNISMNFHIYPNPTKADVNIRIEMSKSVDVTIELFNVLGERIVNENLGDISIANKTISLENHAAGIYVVKVTYGTEASVKRVVLNK